MRRLLSFNGRIAPLLYALAAPILLLLQNLMVALCYRWQGAAFNTDAWFWLLPLRRLAQMPGVTATQAATVFALSLVTTWALAVLSFRRANWSGRGHRLCPIRHLARVSDRRRHNSLRDATPARRFAGATERWLGSGPGPARRAGGRGDHRRRRTDLRIHAWRLWLGLFVATPFVIGMTTGYIVNRHAPQRRGPRRMSFRWAPSAGWHCLCSPWKG